MGEEKAAFGFANWLFAWVQVVGEARKGFTKSPDSLKAVAASLKAAVQNRRSF